MKFLLGAFVAISTSLAASTALAGPFGLQMGTPLSKLTVSKSMGDNSYQISVPSPNSNFEVYYAVVTPETGLCKLMAIGVGHENDSSGIEARTTFDSIESSLKGKYGSGEKLDSISPESTWRGNLDFAIAIRQNERVLAELWKRGQANTLPPDISAILLQVMAGSLNTTYVNIEYQFSNYDRCKDHKANADKDTL